MLTKPTLHRSVTHIFVEHEASQTQQRPLPWLSYPIAVAYVALSVIIMCYASLFSVVPILLFFALWLPLIATKARAILRFSPDMLTLFAVPFLCVVSTIWSSDPHASLYLGTAFMALALCIHIMARTVSFAALIAGLTYGTCAALMITLISGERDSTQALTGLFGSKNQVGFIAEIGCIAACFHFFYLSGFLKKLMLALLPLALCITGLILSVSITAFLSLVATLVILVVARMISRSPPPLRSMILALSITMVGGMLVAASLLGGQEKLLKQLDKNSTLTGRTYLWQEGFAIGRERPLWGHGYSAFWQHGNPRAERYWQEFNIAERKGFHFHNVMIQVFVDLGIAGVLLITLMMLMNCGFTLRELMRHGAAAEPLFLFGMALMFFIRSATEIDFFLGPFDMGTLLFYAILPRLAAYKNSHHFR